MSVVGEGVHVCGNACVEQCVHVLVPGTPPLSPRAGGRRPFRPDPVEEVEDADASPPQKKKRAYTDYTFNELVDELTRTKRDNERLRKQNEEWVVRMHNLKNLVGMWCK